MILEPYICIATVILSPSHIFLAWMTALHKESGNAHRRGQMDEQDTLFIGVGSGRLERVLYYC